MIITVGNTKGGVGKTTLAVNLAIARALAGRDVWLIDGDRQGTAQTAISIRADAGHAPGIACATYPDGPTLRAQVRPRCPQIGEALLQALTWRADIDARVESSDRTEPGKNSRQELRWLLYWRFRHPRA